MQIANTYCMARLPEGRLCQEPIPVTEKLCPTCKERLAAKEKKSAQV